jgi:citrate lyase subunit beta/citryl-CoA lyase
MNTDYTDIDDLAGMRADARRAVELGYDVKPAVNPSKVAAINEAFVPDDEALAWARRVLEARDAADAADRGVFAVDGQMIDRPLLRRAAQLVDRAEAAEER